MINPFKILKFLIHLALKPLRRKQKSPLSHATTISELCAQASALRHHRLKPSTIAHHANLHAMLFHPSRTATHANTTTRTDTTHKTTTPPLDPRLRVCDFSKAHALALIQRLSHLKPSSIQQLLAYLSYALSLAAELSIIPHNPLKSLRRFTPAPLALKATPLIPAAHIRKLLSHATGELQSFLYFAFFTGARASEILALRPRHIRQKHVLIERNATRYATHSPKNGLSRALPLARELQTHLKNTDFKGFSLDYFAIRYRFTKLLKSLRLPAYTIHAARHTFASTCLSQNLPAPLLASYLGHRDTTMLRRVYAHPIREPKHERKIKNLLYFKN